MSTDPDPQTPDPLLEAVLADTEWLAARAAGRMQALATFAAAQRSRRLARWGTVLLATFVIAVGAAWLNHSPVPRPAAARTTAPPAARAATQDAYLTDEQLVASFPPGSCFVAEVDGQPRLVFLDPRLAHRYLGPATAHAN